MSWYGLHPSIESKKYFHSNILENYACCKLCKYKARLVLTGVKYFSNKICNRCGIVFPASQLESYFEKFFIKER